MTRELRSKVKRGWDEMPNEWQCSMFHVKGEKSFKEKGRNRKQIVMVLFLFCLSLSTDRLLMAPTLSSQKKSNSTETLSLTTKYDTYRIKGDCSQNGLMSANLQWFLQNSSWVKLWMEKVRKWWDHLVVYKNRLHSELAKVKKFHRYL